MPTLVLALLILMLSIASAQYQEAGGALLCNLSAFLFAPRQTPLGSILHLTAWLAALSLGLTDFFKTVFQTTWRNVWLGATPTAATLLAFSITVFSYLPVTAQVFGAAGGMVAVMLWVGSSVGIVYYGVVFTHAMLVRHGVIQPELEWSGHAVDPMAPNHTVRQ
jgi:uncharacterized BrkB/YihY/UPF0761 family membrane protein